MYVNAPINRLVFHPTIAIADGGATIVLHADPKFHHAANALHGSVYFKMLDDACFFAVSSIVENVFVLTVSFTTYFTRPVTSGTITSKGHVVHRGKNLYLAEAELVGDDGKIVGRGNGSFMPSQTKLSSDIGYL